MSKMYKLNNFNNEDITKMMKHIEIIRNRKTTGEETEYLIYNTISNLACTDPSINIEKLSSNKNEKIYKNFVKENKVKILVKNIDDLIVANSKRYYDNNDSIINITEQPIISGIDENIVRTNIKALTLDIKYLIENKDSLPFENIMVEIGKYNIFYDLSNFSKDLTFRVLENTYNSDTTKKSNELVFIKFNKEGHFNFLYNNFFINNEENNSTALLVCHMSVMNNIINLLANIVYVLLNPKRKLIMKVNDEKGEINNNTYRKNLNNESPLQKIIYIDITDEKVTKEGYKNRQKVFKKYYKESWQRRGYYRRNKNGKIIFIKPTTCNRKKELLDLDSISTYKDGITTYYI